MLSIADEIHIQVANMLDRRRLERAYNIPDQNITIKMIEFNPQLFFYATIRGSGNQSYIIYNDEAKKEFYHNCPDFFKGNGICKHIAKAALSLPKNHGLRLIKCYYECRIIAEPEFSTIYEQMSEIIAERRNKLILYNCFENMGDIFRAMSSSAIYYSFGLKVLTDALTFQPSMFKSIFAQNEEYDFIFKVLLFEVPIHLRDWVFDQLKGNSIPKWLESMIQAAEMSLLDLYSIKSGENNRIFL
jgi:hypothetical protein